MLDFGALPPEINSGRIYSGPGSGPMTAVAMAWEAVAGQLESVSRGYAAVISGMHGESWSGGASDAMADAAAPYLAWLTTTGATAEQTAIRVRSAAAAYETAFAASVPPALIAANRTQLANLVSTNILGQNATQIAATEADYAQMWAQDAAAMYGYAASSSTATALTPFGEPPQTTTAAAQSRQADAVARAVGGSTASKSQDGLSQLLAAVPQQLQSLSAAGSSASATASSSSVLSSVLSSLSEISSSSSLLTGAGDFNTLSSPVSLAAAFARTAFGGGSFGSGLFRSGIQAGELPGLAMSSPAVAAEAGALAEASSAGPVAAGIGRAVPIGGLSVPQSWASAIPIAGAAEEPQWLSEMDLLGSVPEAVNGAPMDAVPIAGLGAMASMAARPSVSSVFRVEPRRFKMPRPVVGG